MIKMAIRMFSVENKVIISYAEGFVIKYAVKLRN